jgi:hypothetical protein
MYFALVLAGGRQITVFHDLVADGWFLQTTATPAAKAQPLAVLAASHGDPRDLPENIRSGTRDDKETA